MSDYQTLRRRIADELNRGLSDTFGEGGLVLITAINREINSSVKHYQSVRTWWNEVFESPLFTTVDGTKTYTLTSNVVKVDSAKLAYSGNWLRLDRQAWSVLEDEDTTVSPATGLPSEWAFYGNVMRLGPVAPDRSMTCAVSYIRGYPAVSLTASATSTASANPSGGWVQHGEELIRARARQLVKINYLGDMAAKAEAQAYMGQADRFLSLQEEIAYRALMDEAHDRMATGRIRAHEVR